MSDKENIRKLLLEAMNTKDPKTYVDEDEFIDDLDKIKKIRADGTKKARKCANCVCGKYKDEPVPTRRSECGNCYKGDAFRCSGCPSMGLPPYKPGDVVNFDDVEDDI